MVLAGAGLLGVLAAAALIVVLLAVLLLHLLDGCTILLASPTILFGLAATSERPLSDMGISFRLRFADYLFSTQNHL